MPFVTIVNPADHRLDDYRNIPDGDLVARRGIFVAEGRMVVRRLLTESPFATRSVMVTETARASLEDLFTARPDVPVFVVPQAVVNMVTGVHIHRGCLALGERPAAAPFRLQAVGTLVVALERIANADNVGGVFRSALAFGAGAVLLDPISTDPLYRKAIRTSMGATMTVPFARVPWPDTLTELRQQDFAVIAMTPAADAVPLRDCALRLAGRRVALVLGHEGDGLTPAALEACEYRVRIPMGAGVDSLNVATAAAIAMYEFSDV